MDRRRIAGLALAVALGAGATGCIQPPVERRSAVDLKSHLVFVLADAAQDVGAWRVRVDGLDMGPLSALAGEDRRLQVLPGAHVVEIVAPAGTVLVERVFVAEGASRTVQVPGR